MNDIATLKNRKQRRKEEVEIEKEARKIPMAYRAIGENYAVSRQARKQSLENASSLDQYALHCIATDTTLEAFKKRLGFTEKDEMALRAEIKRRQNKVRNQADQVQKAENAKAEKRVVCPECKGQKRVYDPSARIKDGSESDCKTCDAVGTVPAPKEEPLTESSDSGTVAE